MSWCRVKSQIMVVSHGFLKYQFLIIVGFSPVAQDGCNWSMREGRAGAVKQIAFGPRVIAGNA